MSAGTRKNTERNMKRINAEISFVIPVYNGEAVIEELIKSIDGMPEDLSFEILAVNDGSSDGTGEVLSRLKEERDELHVITIPNSGQSAARNTGLKKAKGRYIFFADADDRVIPEGIAALFRKAEEEKLDVACGTYLRFEPGKAPYRACEKLPDGPVSREEDPEFFQRFKTESAFGYIWNKLFRRDFLFEEGLFFDDTIPVYMEDQLLNLKAIASGARFRFLNTPVYQYHFEGESTTRKPDPEIAEKSVAMLKSYDAYLIKKGKREENQDLFVPLFMRMACWAAFKNIRYEGASPSKIRERLMLFSREEAFQEMFQKKESYEPLRALPSFLQRRFFILAFSLMKRKKEGLLAFLFAVLSPALKKAAESMVR